MQSHLSYLSDSKFACILFCRLLIYFDACYHSRPILVCPKFKALCIHMNREDPTEPSLYIKVQGNSPNGRNLNVFLFEQASRNLALSQLAKLC